MLIYCLMVSTSDTQDKSIPFPLSPIIEAQPLPQLSSDRDGVHE